MKLTFFELFLLVFCLIHVVFGELQGPPSETNNRVNDKGDKEQDSKTVQNDRKADEMAKEDASSATTSGFTPEEVIKLIQSSNLEQDTEQNKMTDILSKLVNSYAKYIQEIEDMDTTAEESSVDDEPPKELTPEEKELESLYETAMKILNKTRGDKTAAYAVLTQAAVKGHEKAQAHIAWAQLLGNHMDRNIQLAKETFTKLAENGLPEANLVRVTLDTSKIIILIIEPLRDSDLCMPVELDLTLAKLEPLFTIRWQH